MKNQKLRSIIALIISLVGLLIFASLYITEANKTITTPELIEDLLVESNLENVNSEATADSIAAIQDFIRSSDFVSSSNYLELEGNESNYIVEFRYEENREIRILDIVEVSD
ncbi:hypothetical protein [Alkalicoccobacillus murimartini]|uniref:PepSY domain-containing protein n=1 Tax=Alkalicoccobacillus murimartini TaxID=171685 RepID=A0ABT9YEL1_9BACI|nr:hypothetical protein [Alkalicoccobacillus murimartini]MDQ0206053.1 hypothetical protein [Alkalicoccobacillus murimartini]